MLPGETVILMAIAANKDASKELLTRPVDVTGEYIGYLYHSLIRRGYIRGGSLRGYQLTSMGRQALLAFLDKNENRTKEVTKRLRQLGIECGQEINRPSSIRSK